MTCEAAWQRVMEALDKWTAVEKELMALASPHAGLKGQPLKRKWTDEELAEFSELSTAEGQARGDFVVAVREHNDIAQRHP